MATETSILERLDELRKDIEFIKQHMLLKEDLEDYLAVFEARKEFANKETITLDEMKRILELSNV